MSEPTTTQVNPRRPKTGIIDDMSRSNPEHDDWAEWLFGSLENDGECVEIQYGEVVGQADVRWHTRSHAHYDGVGGFAHVVQSLNGRIVGDLPELPSASRLPCSLDAISRLTALWSEPTAAWNRLPRTGAPQLVVHNRSLAQAWTVFGGERFARLHAVRRTMGASIGGYLLSCLNAGLAPLMSHHEGPALWVVPVNMRGAVRKRRPLSNHLSFVPVPLHEGDSPRVATRLIRTRLADGSHWVLYGAASMAAATDCMAPSVSALAERFRGRSVGIFSNLGAWQVSGLDEGTTWVFCPPVTRFLPLSAGAITVDGVLGLMLQAYPSLTIRQSDLREWMESWIDQIDRQLVC